MAEMRAMNCGCRVRYSITIAAISVVRMNKNIGS